MAVKDMMGPGFLGSQSQVSFIVTRGLGVFAGSGVEICGIVGTRSAITGVVSFRPAITGNVRTSPCNHSS